MVSLKEIEKNGFTLNVSAYVDTSEEEEQIDLDVAIKDMKDAESSVTKAKKNYIAVMKKRLGMSA